MSFSDRENYPTFQPVPRPLEVEQLAQRFNDIHSEVVTMRSLPSSQNAFEVEVVGTVKVRDAGRIIRVQW